VSKKIILVVGSN